ncbi:MAG: hypothetical protein H3C34_22480 [Caldilineaceae bacterium]|nr:hypothetical protein [Caldilineaceae bacterium]
MYRKIVNSLVLMTALFLAACGGSASEPTATPAQQPSAQEVIATTLDVAMHDIYFGNNNDNINNPPVWTVKAGQEMTLNLDNQGGLEHSWAIVKKDAEIPIPYLPESNPDLLLWQSNNVQPAKQAAEAFTAPTVAGEYVVICTVAGHYPAMQGRLVVVQ